MWWVSFPSKESKEVYKVRNVRNDFTNCGDQYSLITNQEAKVQTLFLFQRLI